jgi:hypothetical protein
LPNEQQQRSAEKYPEQRVCGTRPIHWVHAPLYCPNQLRRS